ncbi:hypothetical protein [Escherichia coli]|uniref:hypothetical protein n=1 Tax=Escherichia coli TaxID=562 RepID=UPI00390A313B
MRDLILQLSKSSIYSTKPFAALGELTAAAFNVENNLQLLEASITLAQVHGVENVTNGAIVIHTQRLKSDPGGNLLS